MAETLILVTSRRIPLMLVSGDASIDQSSNVLVSLKADLSRLRPRLNFSTFPFSHTRLVYASDISRESAKVCRVLALIVKPNFTFRYVWRGIRLVN